MWSEAQKYRSTGETSEWFQQISTDYDATMSNNKWRNLLCQYCYFKAGNFLSNKSTRAEITSESIRCPKTILRKQCTQSVFESFGSKKSWKKRKWKNVWALTIFWERLKKGKKKWFEKEWWIDNDLIKKLHRCTAYLKRA